MKPGTYVQHRETGAIGMVQVKWCVTGREWDEVIVSGGTEYSRWLVDEWEPIPDLDAIDWTDHAAFTTECLRTWRAPLAGTEKGRDYLRLGAIGELGEAASIVAKVIRDGTPVDDALRLRFAKEVGDCLWFDAVEMRTWGGVSRVVAPGYLRAVLESAAEIGLCPTIQTQAGHEFLAYCRRLVIAKLRDRAVRGKIGGSGDER